MEIFLFELEHAIKGNPIFPPFFLVDIYKLQLPVYVKSQFLHLQLPYLRILLCCKNWKGEDKRMQCSVDLNKCIISIPIFVHIFQKFNHSHLHQKNIHFSSLSFLFLYFQVFFVFPFHFLLVFLFTLLDNYSCSLLDQILIKFCIIRLFTSFFFFFTFFTFTKNYSKLRTMLQLLIFFPFPFLFFLFFTCWFLSISQSILWALITQVSFFLTINRHMKKCLLHTQSIAIYQCNSFSL